MSSFFSSVLPIPSIQSIHTIKGFSFHSKSYSQALTKASDTSMLISASALATSEEAEANWLWDWANSSFAALMSRESTGTASSASSCTGEFKMS